MINKYIKAVVLAVGVFTLPVLGFTQIKNQSLGTVNGLDITKTEVQREMRKYRSEVYSLVNNSNKKAKSSKAFWEAEKVNGVTGIELLRKKAIDSLTTIKVQEKLLVSRNLWPYKDYSAFLEDLKNTNESRKKSVANDQVVYGPVEYSEQTFFDYRFANALIQLKYKLVEEKLITVTEDDLKNQFRKMQTTVYKDEKDTLKTFKRQVADAYIEHAYNVLITQYSQQAKVNLDLAQINKITLSN